MKTTISLPEGFTVYISNEKIAQRETPECSSSSILGGGGGGGGWRWRWKC